jgi:hypothetical protein
MVCDKVIRLSSKIYFLNKILESENKITSGRDDDVTEENISDHAKDKDDAVDCKKYPSEKISKHLHNRDTKFIWKIFCIQVDEWAIME